MSVHESNALICDGANVTRRLALRLLASGLLTVGWLSTLADGAAAQDGKPEGGGAPLTPPAHTTDNEERRAAAEQFSRAYASEVLLEAFRPPDGQQPRRDELVSEERIANLLVYIGPAEQQVTNAYSIDSEGMPRFVACQIREANIHNARDHITADAIYATLAKYYLPFPEPFASAVWKQYRKQDGAPTIERAWNNEDGSVETVGAALWGNNPADGPGNYLVIRARLFPGSPHHAARTLFTS